MSIKRNSWILLSGLLVCLVVLCFLFPSPFLHLADGVARHFSSPRDCMSFAAASHSNAAVFSEPEALPLQIASGYVQSSWSSRGAHATYESTCLIRSSDGAFLGSYDASNYLPGNTRLVHNILFTFKSLVPSDQSLPTNAFAGSGSLCARNIVTQTDSWCVRVNSLPTMLVSGSIIYTPEMALRASDGSILWHFQIPLQTMYLTQVQSKTYLVGLQGDSSDTRICVFKPLTGESLWCVPAKQASLSKETLFATIGDLVLTSKQNVLTARRVEDGTIVWPTQPAAFISVPSLLPSVLSDSKHFIIANGEEFQAINPANGSILWQISNRDTVGMFLADGVLVVATGDFGQSGAPGHTGMLFGRSLVDGHLLWQQASPYIYWAPTDAFVSAGMIYFSGTTPGGNLVYALRVKDGKRLWSDLACDSPLFWTLNGQRQSDGSVQHCYWSNGDTNVQLPPQFV